MQNEVITRVSVTTDKLYIQTPAPITEPIRGPWWKQTGEMEGKEGFVTEKITERKDAMMEGIRRLERVKVEKHINSRVNGWMDGRKDGDTMMEEWGRWLLSCIDLLQSGMAGRLMKCGIDLGVAACACLSLIAFGMYCRMMCHLCVWRCEGVWETCRCTVWIRSLSSGPSAPTSHWRIPYIFNWLNLPEIILYGIRVMRGMFTKYSDL